VHQHFARGRGFDGDRKVDGHASYVAGECALKFETIDTVRLRKKRDADL
jgi:hypothetical protein